MSSIINLRWYNLFGAIPVGIMNGMIAFVNICYIFQIYTKEELFKMIEISNSSDSLKYFLNFYIDDIRKFFPDFKVKNIGNIRVFFFLEILFQQELFLLN